MKAFLTKSSWLRDESRRLDAPVYGEGGFAAADRIKVGPWSVARLSDVARLFNGSRFARVYVSDATRGAPYLTGSDMLLVDLKGLLFLSIARTPQMHSLRIQPSWTLLSCSGTIGRTVYVRNEMTGMALSHDVIRVVANEGSILPGYLFAFLTSAPAQAMIRQRTYGSVVQHIEPHHLADMPIPLLDEAEQRHIHHLVERAAAARTQASQLLDEASDYFDGLVGPLGYVHEHDLAVGIVRRSVLRQSRLDAFTHTGWAAEAAVPNGDRLNVLAGVSSPNIRKRVFAQRGTPFVSGVDIFQLRPTARTRLRIHEAERYGALIQSGQLVVQRTGQRYGLLGRPAFVGSRLDGWACSQHLIRIMPRSPTLTGRLFAFLRSETGRRQLVGQSCGTSIPAINSDNVAGLVVPPLPADLTVRANRALSLREQADADDESAIREVETWLA